MTCTEKVIWNTFDKCSDCGSIRPHLFLVLLETETLTLWNKDYCFVGPYKFYYCHLSKTQKVSFLIMWNDKELTICEKHNKIPSFIKE